MMEDITGGRLCLNHNECQHPYKLRSTGYSAWQTVSVRMVDEEEEALMREEEEMRVREEARQQLLSSSNKVGDDFTNLGYTTANLFLLYWLANISILRRPYPSQRN